MKHKKISIIIPVYFNAESLDELFGQLQAVEEKLHAKSMDVELIFVDDGSRDRSFDVLLDIKRKRPETKLIRLTRNFGGAAGSSAAFPHATGDCIAVVAADLQDPPEQVIAMVDEWEQGHLLVFCHRRSRQDPWTSRVLAAIYYRLLDMLVVKNYPKGGADMILMDKSLLPHILHLKRGINYSVYLFWLGFQPKLLAYDRLARKHGKSRWTFKKKFFFFLDNVTGLSATPLRFVSSIGLIVSLICLCYGIVLIAYALNDGVEVPGFTTLAVLISFSTTIIVTMLSIVGEYLWRIFEIISQRPHSVIAETYLEP